MPSRALVIGASGGIGAAIVHALQARGDDVTTVSRSADGLDVTDAASVTDVMERVEGPFDLILVAIGVLGTPEKSLCAIDAAAMAQVMAVNAIGPALILRHAAQLMPREGRSLCAVLSARVGSIADNEIGGWHSYRASKAALNQIVHGAAIELKRSHKDSIVMALHPGTVETPFTAAYAGHHSTVTPQVAADNLIKVIDAATPAQSGGFFDYAGKEIPW